MFPHPHFERCLQCNEPLHFFQYISTKDELGISLCAACEKTYRSKLPRATAVLHHSNGHKTVDIAIEPLQRIVAIRISNRLVNDRIAETVRSIRHLYDRHPHRRRSGGDQSGQMHLF